METSDVPLQVLDQPCLLLTLPAELCWAIVDMLLLCEGGAGEAARLGLTCRQLASTILDDERAWRFRCDRDLGTDRMNLHAERERFGVAWPRFYAAARADKAFSRRFSAIWHFLRGGSESWWRWTCPATKQLNGYAVTVRRSCWHAGHNLVVIEHAQCTDEEIAGWVSMRRATPDRPVIPLSRSDDFCACVQCRGGTPKPRELVRARLAVYRGGWRGGYPHGRGRATFASGLVYEGQWEKGLPHGHGKLNGTARTWTRGVCAAMGSWSRPLHDPDAPSYYGQYALLPESTRGLDFTSSRDTALREWWWITTAVGKRAPPAWTPLQPDTTRLPHGEGKAFYPDGKVYSGTWRLGQRHRGRCTLPDGTSFQGVWYHGGPRSTAIGNVSWSSGTHLKHEVVWDDQDRMRSDGGVVRSKHRVYVYDRATPRPCAASGQRVLTRTAILANGDECDAQWTSRGIMHDVTRFVFSSACADPTFAGVTINDCAWTCVPLSWQSPPRHTCPDDYVYWPADRDSEAFLLFPSYVRKRLIPWDDETVDFFWHNAMQECDA